MEKFMFDRLNEIAHSAGVPQMTALSRPTARNAPRCDLYDQFGFGSIAESIAEVQTPLDVPPHDLCRATHIWKMSANAASQ